jgi:hypothetical protein
VPGPLPQQIHNLPNLPSVGRNVRCHRRRHSQRLVNAAEVVVHEVQRDGAAWFSNFFEEAVVRRGERRMLIRMVRL